MKIYRTTLLIKDESDSKESVIRTLLTELLKQVIIPPLESKVLHFAEVNGVKWDASQDAKTHL
jgi:hypothetical protein